MSSEGAVRELCAHGELIEGVMCGGGGRLGVRLPTPDQRGTRSKSVG